MKHLITLLSFITFFSCDNSTEREFIVESLTTDTTVQELSPQVLTKEEKPHKGRNRLDEVLAIIPEGYQIVNRKEGQELIFTDLDKDGQEDALTLLELRGDTTYDQSEEVMIAIFSRDRHGELAYISSSKNIGGEALMYNDQKSLSVKKNVISYFHQSMRHELTLKFRYEIEQADFMLIGKDFNSYGSIDEGASSISINYLTGMKLINESKWDEDTEELVDLPQQKKTFPKKLQSLSTIDFDTMYNDL